MTANIQWVCLAWAPYSRRTEMFARILEGKLYCIHHLHFQRPLYAPVKYVLQAFHTWKMLFVERPQAVLVQNPPIVCGLVVYLYSLLSPTTIVFDHHTAAFASVWNWALPLQRYLARKAATNIVTNQHWLDIIYSWNAPGLIMGDPFLDLPQGEVYPVSNAFNIALINTFAPDEPLDAVLVAAEQLPQVQFYITGNTKHKPQAFFDHTPTNVTFTDFLPDAQYLGLLHAVDAIMVLTTRNHTLQLGGCEAVAVGQPLITSDWPFLKEFFRQGTVYVDNSSAEIYAGITNIQHNYQQLKTEMRTFRETARQEWDAQYAKLIALVTEVIQHEGD